MTLQEQLGTTTNLSACDAVGGSIVANINDPAKLISEGLADVKIGDKLEVTRISNDQVLAKNIRTGSLIKLGAHVAGKTGTLGYVD
jgi:hypothetical protein